MKQFILFFLYSFLSFACLAANQLPNAQGLSDSSQFKFPKGCKAEGYEYLGNYVYLNSRQTNEAHLYLLFNQSDFTVSMDHIPAKNPGMSAGWGSKIDAKHWSAIMVPTAKTHFKLTCNIVNKKGTHTAYSTANCSRVIKICKYERYNAPQSMMQGGYWLAENHTLKALLAKIKSRGVDLNSSESHQ